MNKKVLFSLMAVILLACNSVTSSFATATPIKQINDRAADSPQPDKVAPSDTPTAAVTDTATPTHEPGCSELNLTPEECATSGTHLYKLNGTVTGDCRYEGGRSVETITTATFSFTEDKLVKLENVQGGCAELLRTSKNSFAADCVFPATDRLPKTSMTENISFNDNGFVDIKSETWIDRVSGRTMACTWTETYEPTK